MDFEHCTTNWSWIFRYTYRIDTRVVCPGTAVGLAWHWTHPLGYLPQVCEGGVGFNFIVILIPVCGLIFVGQPLSSLGIGYSIWVQGIWMAGLVPEHYLQARGYVNGWNRSNITMSLIDWILFSQRHVKFRLSIYKLWGLKTKGNQRISPKRLILCVISV